MSAFLSDCSNMDLLRVSWTKGVVDQLESNAACLTLLSGIYCRMSDSSFRGLDSESDIL